MNIARSTLAVILLGGMIAGTAWADLPVPEKMGQAGVSTSQVVIAGIAMSLGLAILGGAVFRSSLRSRKMRTDTGKVSQTPPADRVEP